MSVYVTLLTYSIDSAQQAINGIPLNMLSDSLLLMSGLFLIEGVIGFWLFTRFETLAKQYGTLTMT